MAQYTKHPVSAPPTAPERESTGHLLLRAYAIVVFIAAFAHSAVYNLLGGLGAGLVMIVFLLSAAAIGVPMIVRAQPHAFTWRRLPWSALGYVSFALLSVAWSQWRGQTAIAWLLLVAVAVNALLIAHVLSWQEIVHTLASAFKWILGLSLALELWASLIVHAPLLPNFFVPPEGSVDPHWYWVRDNFFDGGRIQGIVGDSNALAIICLLAIVTFGVRFALRSRWRTTLVMWTLLAIYLLFRADAATAYVCAFVAAIVLAAALLIRRARTPASRTRMYITCVSVFAVIVAAFAIFRGPLFEALGRSADLNGRPDVLDVLAQLGVVGALLIAAAFLGLLWRAWFFAADRPRWDLRADRPYSSLTLLPLLFTVILLVQALAQSSPFLLWGWMVLMLFSFKIKSVPLVGVGLNEQARVTERGRTARRIP